MLLLVACMQDWQEICLCPSPATTDLSQDLSASYILLIVFVGSHSVAAIVFFPESVVVLLYVKLFSY